MNDYAEKKIHREVLMQITVNDIFTLDKFYLTIISIGAVCSAGISYRFFFEFLSMSDALSKEWVISLSVIISAIIGIGIFISCFQSAMRMYEIHGHTTKDFTFWQSVKATWQSTHKAFIGFALSGIFGGTIIMYMVAVSNLEKTDSAIDNLPFYQSQLQNLETDYSDKKANYESAIERYKEVDKFTYGVVPTQQKLDQLTTDYWKRKTFLLNKISELQNTKNRANVTGILTDFTGNDKASILLASFLFGGIFLSFCVVDMIPRLFMYVAFRKTYCRLFLDRLRQYNINNIESNYTEKTDSDFTDDYTENGDYLTTSEDVENSQKDEFDYTLIDGDTGLQKDIMKEWFKGNRNFTKIAKKTNSTRVTARDTVKRFDPDGYEKFRKRHRNTPKKYKNVAETNESSNGEYNGNGKLTIYGLEDD